MPAEHFRSSTYRPHLSPQEPVEEQLPEWADTLPWNPSSPHPAKVTAVSETLFGLEVQEISEDELFIHFFGPDH